MMLNMLQCPWCVTSGNRLCRAATREPLNYRASLFLWFVINHPVRAHTGVKLDGTTAGLTPAGTVAGDLAESPRKDCNRLNEARYSP